MTPNGSCGEEAHARGFGHEIQMSRSVRGWQPGAAAVGREFREDIEEAVDVV